MDYCSLGRSSLMVGVLTYGNWVTHGLTAVCCALVDVAINRRRSSLPTS